MASSSSSFLHGLLLLFTLFQCSFGARQLTSLVQQATVLTYHQGQLLTGPIFVHLIWYGKFSPSQRAIITDFITSLSSKTPGQPSVAAWWKTTEKYYHQQSKSPVPILTLGTQTIDEDYSLGTQLSSTQIATLAARGGKRRSINVVLTSDDVSVEGFCSSRCGTHGASPRSRAGRFAYIWVGNSATQCPGLCAWPFHQPIYGSQNPPLVAPNGDVGVDGMVVNLASLLAGTVTNPFGNGYFQGSKYAPMEAASACPGVYGKGAYPGYAGDVLVDGSTGGSYNANGSNGRKYLLPALVDPTTSACSTLV